MARAVAQCLQARGPEAENLMMSRVFSSVANLVTRYCDIMHVDDHPFAYNETASVSMICSAANVAGYAAIAEYCWEKAYGRTGRVDLYIASPTNDWIVEAKQWSPYDAPKDRLISYARNALNDAVSSATGGETALGLLMVPLWHASDSSVIERTLTNIDEASALSRHAWLIKSPRGERHTTAFLFQGKEAL